MTRSSWLVPCPSILTQISIGATVGSYSGMPPQRRYEIRLVNCLPPQVLSLRLCERGRRAELVRVQEKITSKQQGTSGPLLSAPRAFAPVPALNHPHPLLLDVACM